jgi:lysyl-tRNA synthetase class 2
MLRELLKNRGSSLKKARQFFEDREIIEVDAPIINLFPSIDPHIDVMETNVTFSSKGYLHTSPEISLKKLLSKGSGDIYYLGHVFRLGDEGAKHQPEFMMAEWYRVGFSLDQLIEETLNFIKLFLPSLPYAELSYHEAFQKFLDVDPEDEKAIEKLATLIAPESIKWTHSERKYLLIGAKIEPFLGINEFLVLRDFPPSEAGLAKVKASGNRFVAERFEIYFQGIELCNGYEELTIGSTIKKRWEEENLRRENEGKDSYPIDQEFIDCLNPNFPSCSGVSVGFDRLMMLKNKTSKLKDLLPLCWSNQNANSLKNSKETK